MADKTVKAKNKTINLKEIQRIDKKMDRMSTKVLSYDLKTNTNTVIKYYELFSDEKIIDLLEEAHEAIHQAQEDEDIPFLKGERQDTDLLGFIEFLIAVRFTNLSDQVPRNFHDSYPIMLQMRNQGLTKKIHNEILDPSESSKVFERMTELTEAVGLLIDTISGEQKEVFSQIRNKEILNLGKPRVIHPLNNPDVVK